MRLPTFFILICIFLSTELCAQQTSSETSIVFDFSPFTQSISRQVVEEVGNSPIPFEATNSATYSGEITVLRNFAHWSFGIGVSTNSYRQNFNHTFYFNPDFELSRYQTSLSLKGMALVHMPLYSGEKTIFLSACALDDTDLYNKTIVPLI